MKKTIAKILILFMAAPFFVSCGYNKMVKLDENVKAQWAQVQSVYQRRSDLIPNLVATVKGVANFEQSTLTAVIEARANATKVNIDASKLTPETFQQFQQAQNGLSSALSRLMVVSEQYPELKATQNFSELQTQLESTENRITVERQKFNDATREYNTFIRGFIQRMWANMFDFKEKPYFEAVAGSEKAPEVKF